MVPYSSHIFPIVKVPSNGLSHANHVKGGIFGAFTRQTIDLLEIEAPSWVLSQDGLVPTLCSWINSWKTETRDTLKVKPEFQFGEHNLDWLSLVLKVLTHWCELVFQVPDFSHKDGRVLRASTGNLGAENGVTLGALKNSVLHSPKVPSITLWVFGNHQCYQVNPPGPGDFAISAATAGRHWKFPKPIAGAAQ